jgi:hypothetical protein
MDTQIAQSPINAKHLILPLQPNNYDTSKNGNNLALA